MSTSWGFGTTFDDWNIRQIDDVTIGGINFDTNEANSLYRMGAW